MPASMDFFRNRAVVLFAWGKDTGAYWHILAHTCTYMQIHTHACIIPTFGFSFLVHQNTKNMASFSACVTRRCLAHGCLEGVLAKFEVAWMILEEAMLVSRQRQETMLELHESNNKCLFSADAEHHQQSGSAYILPICRIWTLHYSTYWLWGLNIILHIYAI